jgi:hypothetical protein
MILTITVTKEILEASKMCGRFDKQQVGGIGENCAVALAVRDIFPNAYVATEVICPLGISVGAHQAEIKLPREVSDFIRVFDFANPEKRIQLPELSFDINIPDSIIEQIDISEISKLLEGHPTLKLQTV